MPSVEALSGLFENLGDALSRGDAEAAADCFGTPLMLLGDEQARPITDTGELRQLFRGAIGAYQDHGAMTTTPTVQHVEQHTPRLCSATVRWPYMTADGRQLGEEVSFYVVWIDDDGRPRIRVALPW